jgi:anti-sigma regulatory factor (Ser/Thr protein kinase)
MVRIAVSEGAFNAIEHDHFVMWGASCEAVAEAEIAGF